MAAVKGFEEMSGTTLTVQSAIHGERIWQHVGQRDHVTHDGRAMVLAVWETHCVVCGAPFQAATPGKVTAREQSSTFNCTTCPRHRMTPTEISRLRRAKATDRRAIFEEIRKAKLATTSEWDKRDKRDKCPKMSRHS
jgi:hypothetical protein